MSRWMRPVPEEWFLRSTQERQTRVRAQRESFAGQSLATRPDKEKAYLFLQGPPSGKARSSCARGESTKAKVTQHQIEEQTRRDRYQIKSKDACDTGKISERNERDLGSESNRD